MAALELASEADPVAEAIGAANTLVRQPGGGLKAYNTDWSAAIGAVEAALLGPPPACSFYQSSPQGRLLQSCRACACGASARCISKGLTAPAMSAKGVGEVKATG